MATILVVEDDPDTAEFLALVLADITMPGMDGSRLCQRMADDPRYHAIPRVLMSVWWHDDGARLPCVSAFLPKPFTIPVLLNTVWRYVY